MMILSKYRPGAIVLLAAIIFSAEVFTQQIIDGKVPDGATIALQSDAGTWLARCNGCQKTKGGLGDTAMVHAKGEVHSSGAVYSTLKPWARWTVVHVEEGKIALKADTGKYLARCRDCIIDGTTRDFATVHATEPFVKIASFTPEFQKKTETYAFKADTGEYLARCRGCSPGASFQDAATIHITDPSGKAAQWKIYNIEIKTTPARPDGVPLTEEEKEYVLNFLGKGYHGGGQYANVDYFTKTLFDLSNSNIDRYVSILRNPKFDELLITGIGLNKYMDDLGIKTGIEVHKGLFSAGLEHNFSTSSSKTAETAFATKRSRIKYYLLDLDKNTPLKKEVASDINKADATELFKTYGTHYTKSVFIGGSLSFSSKVERSEFEGKSNYVGEFNVAYGETVDAKGSVESKNSSLIKKFKNNSNIDINGGDPALASKLQLKTSVDSETYDNWLSTVQKNMSMAGFGKGGLVPIYTLATEKLRKDSLKKAMEEYLQKGSN